MLEFELSRLEHEMDDSLLFYYSEKDQDKREALLMRAMESSLECLQHCRDSLRIYPENPDVLVQSSRHMEISRNIVHEVFSSCFRPEKPSEDSYWKTLLDLWIALYSDLMVLSCGSFDCAPEFF